MTEKGSKNMADDGKLFCKNLAAYTGAQVFASSETQMYNHDSFWRLINPNAGVIDFGKWEGPVYSFSPDGVVKLVS